MFDTYKGSINLLRNSKEMNDNIITTQIIFAERM